MSGKVVGWVVESSPETASAGDMVVALLLAQHANAAGEHAYPSVAELARGAHLCERQVQRALKRLTDYGLIEIERPATNRLPAMYRFPGFQSNAKSRKKGRARGDISDTPPEGLGVTFDPSRGDIMSPLGATFPQPGVTFTTSRGDIYDTTLIGREPSEEPIPTEPLRGAEKTAQKNGVTPYAIFAAICEAAGQDCDAYSDREKGKHLAVAKRLLNEGATEDEVRQHVGWLRSQHWRTSPVTVFVVEKEIGTWRAAHRPKGTPPDARNGRPTQADLNSARRAQETGKVPL